jgi:F-type H+-transporting ATPase subunit b
VSGLRSFIGALALVLALVAPARAEEEHGAAHEAAQGHERRGEAVESAEHEGTGDVGGEHEGAHVDSGKLAAQLLNFAALAFVLVWFGGKAINKALLARHQQLKSEMASAAEAKAAAEARLAVQEKRLAALEQEIASIRAGIKEEAEAEKARLIALAEERAKRIKDETSFLLAQQVKEAELQLRHEAGKAAVDMAEQLVKKAMGPADQQRMVDSFVGDVATPPRKVI